MSVNSVSRRVLLRNSLACAIPLGAAGQTGGPSVHTADLCIYGATPGGIATAVAAARLGRKVLLIEYEDHIGGIVSNGLTNADIGKRQAVGGLFYEFTRRVVRHYQDTDRNNSEQPNVKLCRDGYWYEASAAERIFHQLIDEQQGRIQLLLSHELKKALVSSNRLVAITAEHRGQPGRDVKIEAKCFVDATYEGDLAAMAGVPFRTGRESRAEYNEPHAGRIYMRFGTTEFLPGSTGEADNATQAYCFRFHVTNDPAKRVPIEKPAGYNRDDYKLTLEDIRAGRITKFRQVIQVYAMPNGRFELNSDHVHPDTGLPRESLDLAEECWDWPTATPARRRKIYERYRTHNVGMIWLLQNDPEVPEPLRRDASQYGWHRDEWPDNGHIPRQVYVRQGRRILGDYVLTERDCDVIPELSRTKIRPDSIAVLEWGFDPHGHHKYDPKHPGCREGYVMIYHEPFQVPYGVLVPRKIEGLLVPVACSCSHVAYNALRMEPVFMALGEACGIAAHLALRDNVPVRRAPVGELQKLLADRRGVLTFFEDVPFDHANFAALQWVGARGFNKGYRAQPGMAVTRELAHGALQRVFQSERKTWSPPAGNPAEPFTAKALRAELQRAGYNVNDGPADGPLTVEQMASLMYAAMAPGRA